MTSIHTLIPDIYKLVGSNHGISDSITSDMGVDIASAIKTSLSPQERRSLRLSGLGPKCDKQLWHTINTPELAEPLPAAARIKFLYGHILEHTLIGLAKAAGHSVVGEQDELTVDGVTGHRDCVIDGAIVDVKSSSSRGFQKFKDQSLWENDDFGYLDQLDGYLVGSLDDPLVTIKDRAYLLAIDKTLGHLALYEHHLREESIRKRIRTYRDVVSLDRPPKCTCETLPDGESGNIKLGVGPSYSAFKHVCHPQLRTVLYARGPVYFTKIVKYPMHHGKPLPELTNRLH